MAVSGAGFSSGVGSNGHSHIAIAWWLDIIPSHHNLQHLQKAVLLEFSRILRKVMSPV